MDKGKVTNQEAEEKMISHYDAMFIMMYRILPILVVSIFASHIYFSIYNRRLILYLRKHKPRRWKKLTTASFGKHMNIHFGLMMIPYIFNDLDTKDETIRQYKKKVGIGIKLLPIYLIILFLWVIVSVIISIYLGGS